MIGDVWWAGAEVNIPNSPHPGLRGARLECTSTPHSQVWTTGYLHLWGTAIVPNALYEVTVCAPDGTDCSSIAVGTGEWGDAVSPFGGPSQPNFKDIEYLIYKFRNMSQSPDMPRVDIVGSGTPGQPNASGPGFNVVNFQDISSDVESFRGIGYAYTVPACSP
jgi:hypothetical protein